MSNAGSLPLIDRQDSLRRGLGCLLVERDSKQRRLPLSAVSISAQVADRIAEVTVIQKFKNTFADYLEAVYIFPLPGGSAVSKFEMRVADRVIAGVVEERQKAREDYQAAIKEGRRAALLEQERDNVFTMQVGNIPPNEEISVELVYSERLSFYDDGTTELRLPVVVAPRYIPGNELARDQVGEGVEADTDVVPDASRITPPRLAPGFDPKVSLQLNVFLLTGENNHVADLCCSQHAVKSASKSGATKVSLSLENEPLNRDFVLRWRLTEKTIKSRFIYYREPESTQCYGMLSLLPPQRESSSQAGRDIIFVVDRSGSMDGEKMTSALQASSILLNTLGPADRFAIQAFDDRVDWMDVAGEQESSASSERFIAADQAGVEKGLAYLRTLDARGGTNLDTAVREALNEFAATKKPAERVQVIVLLTDGEIGQERQALELVQKAEQNQNVRFFTIGIDTAVNDGLIKRLAELGRGFATFVQPGAQLDDALVKVGRQIGNPLITDLKITGSKMDLDADSLAPSRVPDLFAGQASTCFFKFNCATGATPKLTVTGSSSSRADYKESVSGLEVPLNAVSHLWARLTVARFEDQYRVAMNGREAIMQEIVQLSKRHSVLSRFTAFVVVDDAEVVNKTGAVRKMVQPVEIPAQWVPAANTVSQQLRYAAPQAAPQAQFGTTPGSWGAAAYSQPPMAPSSSSAASFQSPQSFSGGSYGSGVRQQVLIVIAHQAIAGADWRTICAGPMQVNNISEREVEVEVSSVLSNKYRQITQKILLAFSGGATSDQVLADFNSALNEFVLELQAVAAVVRSTDIAELTKLNAAREKLLALLVSQSLAWSKQLQEFLENQFGSAKPSTCMELNAIMIRFCEVVEQSRVELEKGASQPFWQSTI